MCGELGMEMFIIERGQISVTNEDRSLVFLTLGPMNFIGEASLLKNTKRNASAYAVGFCDTYVLSKDNFAQVTYPPPLIHMN
jgi:CRP-like cAMP-binding protein